MRKGILLIGSYPPPFGGISSHLQYLAPYLSSQGYDVHVISSGSGKSMERINNFTVYRMPSRSRKIIEGIYHFLRTWTGIAKLRTLGLKSMRESLRVIIPINIIENILCENRNIRVISAYHLFPEGLIGAILSESFSIPLVVTNFGEIYTNLSFYKERLSVVKYICEKSSKMLSSSQHCARSYKLLNIAPNIEVIPYGIDVKYFSPENQGIIVRQKFGISDQDKIVLFVGRMSRDMGLYTLLVSIPQILKVQSNTKFIIAGAKGELFESALELQAKYKNNVFVVSDVCFKELSFYYASSTIVTAPSPDERSCMGLAIKEAMATGKPVVAAKVGGIPEAVIHGETGILVPPESPYALGDAILNLLNDENAIARMGRAGRQRAIALFDKELTNQKIYRIFQEVTSP